MTDTTRQASNENTPEEKLYWPQLDGLRSLAFFLVFLSHLPFPPLIPTLAQSPVCMFFLFLWVRVCSWGWVGVELFFVLSAFLITTLLLKEHERFQSVSFRSFMIRRILRIWPLYFTFLFAGFLVVLPLIGFNITHFAPADWWSGLWHYFIPFLFFLGNFSMTGPEALIVPGFLLIGWSVAIEEQFYIVIGLLLSRVFNRKILWGVITLGLIVSVSSRWLIQLHAATHKAYYFNSFSHLDSLLSGMALALLLNSRKLKLPENRGIQAFLFILPILFYLCMVHTFTRILLNPPEMVWLLTLISAMCAVFIFSLLQKSVFQRFFSQKWLVNTGRITYAMYLFHPFVLWLVDNFFTTPLTHAIRPDNQFALWAVSALLSLTTTWLMAFASWHWLEKRFYNQRYRFSRIPSGFGAVTQTNQNT